MWLCDNIFAAVDVHTAALLLDTLRGPLLAGKTRIVATSHRPCIQAADMVVTLGGGSILQVGAELAIATCLRMSLTNTPELATSLSILSCISFLQPSERNKTTHSPEPLQIARPPQLPSSDPSSTESSGRRLAAQQSSSLSPSSSSMFPTFRRRSLRGPRNCRKVTAARPRAGQSVV